MLNNRFCNKNGSGKDKITFSACQPLLGMSSKAVKLNQYVMHTSWNKWCSCLTLFFQKTFPQIWLHCDMVTLWHWEPLHKEPRALLVDGPVFLCVMGSSVQPDLVWSLCWLQHCRSVGAAPSSAFPHTVLHWNYADGLKALALGDNSLSCHKQAWVLMLGSLWSPGTILAVGLPTGMETSPMGSQGRGCNRAAWGSQDGERKY